MKLNSEIVRDVIVGLATEAFGSEPTREELHLLHAEVESMFHGLFVEAAERARNNFIGPKPFCQTPSGLYDRHGSYIRIAGPMEIVCVFCDRPTNATPANPEGQGRNAAIGRRVK